MKRAECFSVDQGWRVLLQDLGVNPAQVLQMAELPGDLFLRKGASLSPTEYYRLWQGLEMVFGDPTFPLRIMQNLSIEVFDPALFAAYCSPNLTVALQRLSEFKALIGPLRLENKATADKTQLVIYFPDVNLDIPTSLIAAELTFFTQLARMATREAVVPLRVMSPVDLLCNEAYAEYFGVLPIKGKAVSITFSAADAARPFVTDNPQMWEAFEPALRKRLADLDTDADFSTRVHSTLLELLPSGRSSIDDVTAKLLVSKRTLQRRLNQEETSYQTILNKVREELARHYLTNSAMSANQISFLLGYDDPNSFFRAFHTWTGSTPETIRNQHLH